MIIFLINFLFNEQATQINNAVAADPSFEPTAYVSGWEATEVSL